MRTSLGRLARVSLDAAAATLAALTGAATWRDGPDPVVLAAGALAVALALIARRVLAQRDERRLRAALEHRATHDGLTGLPNRELFHSRLGAVLATPGQRRAAVLLFDLDDFKEINETLGHEAGDELLAGVARRLESCVRAGDTVARLGGDEFALVLDDAPPSGADHAAERLAEALLTPLEIAGHELPVRASIGIADGRAGDDPSELLRHAEVAMYAAKRTPGTTHARYEPSMAADGHSLGAELRDAINGEQLFLLYQPIVRLTDGHILGAEALVRWAHPRLGALAPDSFIPLAERTGLIVPLGRWVLRTAVTQLAEWRTEHGPDALGVLNVNVSARDLREASFADELRALLTRHGVPADRLSLEITETMALEPGQSVTTLHQLRALGVRISLDDFGTGHSTLTLLHDCPIDEIKLDKSFTQSDNDRVPIAAALINLAASLGLHAVAEGVETAEQAQQLVSLGYQAAQGYYYARPLPPHRLGELLSADVTLTPAVSTR